MTSDLRSYGTRKYLEGVSTSSNGKLVASLPPKKRNLLILAKNSGKIDIKLFPLRAISHES